MLTETDFKAIAAKYDITDVKRGPDGRNCQVWSFNRINEKTGAISGFDFGYYNFEHNLSADEFEAKCIKPAALILKIAF